MFSFSVFFFLLLFIHSLFCYLFLPFIRRFIFFLLLLCEALLMPHDALKTKMWYGLNFRYDWLASLSTFIDFSLFYAFLCSRCCCVYTNASLLFSLCSTQSFDFELILNEWIIYQSVARLYLKLNNDRTNGLIRRLDKTSIILSSFFVVVSVKARWLDIQPWAVWLKCIGDEVWMAKR